MTFSDIITIVAILFSIYLFVSVYVGLTHMADIWEQVFTDGTDGTDGIDGAEGSVTFRTLVLQVYRDTLTWPWFAARKVRLQLASL